MFALKDIQKYIRLLKISPAAESYVVKTIYGNVFCRKRIMVRGRCAVFLFLQEKILSKIYPRIEIRTVLQNVVIATETVYGNH